jgi:chemotaxis protein histidine kinase CheA
MIDHSDETLQDFLAGVDDFYEAAQEGLDSIRSGDVAAGIDTLLRPLHTIKGTAGFIPGLEPLKEYVHETESLLKNVQEGGGVLAPEGAGLLISAVDEVFDLCETLKQGALELDIAKGRELLRMAADAQTPARASGPQAPSFPVHYAHDKDVGAGGGVRIEETDQVAILRVDMPRIHLPRHYRRLTEAADTAGDGAEVVLDLSRVRTLSSTAWGQIIELAKRRRVSVVGLNEPSRITFQVWGLEKIIKAFPSEKTFWLSRRTSAEDTVGRG